MRAKVDVLRSMQKYVSQVLAPNPTLAAFSNGGTPVWTTAGMVAGAIDLPLESWLWLRGWDRHPPVVRGSAADPSTYYLESTLVSDPLPAAEAAGVDLTGPLSTTSNLPTQPKWEVRTWYDRDEVPPVPHARVHFTGAGGTTGPAHWYELVQPMAIECYPEPGDSVKESTCRATAVEDVLLAGFRGAGIGAGRPLRIPLWDFDGVGLDETSEVRGESDYMRLQDFSTRQLPDPLDPRRVRVIAELRVSWRKGVDLTTLKTRTPGMTEKGTRYVRSVLVEVDSA
jgi:hypothetical protein